MFSFYLHLWSSSMSLVLSLYLLVFPQLCLLSKVPLWSETTELSLQWCGLESKWPNLGRSDWATLYVPLTKKRKEKNVFKSTLGHNSRAGFFGEGEAGRIDITDLACTSPWSGPFEEWDSAKSCLCLNQVSHHLQQMCSIKAVPYGQQASY